MALTKVRTGGITEDAVDNTILKLDDNFALTGTVSGTGMDLLLTHYANSGSPAYYDISSTYINSTYDNYYLVGYFEGDADTKYLQMQVFVGGTVQTGNIYGFSNQYIDSDDAHSNAQGEPNLVTCSTFGMGGEDGEGTHISAVFQNANNPIAPFCVNGNGCRHSTGANHAGIIFSGSMLPSQRASVVNGLRLKMHSGDITNFKFKFYGMKD